MFREDLYRSAKSLGWWAHWEGLRVIPLKAKHEKKHEMNGVGYTQLQGNERYKYGLGVCWFENHQQSKTQKSIAYQNNKKSKRFL